MKGFLAAESLQVSKNPYFLGLFGLIGPVNRLPSSASPDGGGGGGDDGEAAPPAPETAQESTGLDPGPVQAPTPPPPASAPAPGLASASAAASTSTPISEPIAVTEDEGDWM